MADANAAAACAVGTVGFATGSFFASFFPSLRLVEERNLFIKPSPPPDFLPAGLSPLLLVLLIVSFEEVDAIDKRGLGGADVFPLCAGDLGDGGAVAGFGEGG